LPILNSELRCLSTTYLFVRLDDKTLFFVQTRLK
jgi:hypothetical protein